MGKNLVCQGSVWQVVCSEKVHGRNKHKNLVSSAVTWWVKMGLHLKMAGLWNSHWFKKCSAFDCEVIVLLMKLIMFFFTKKSNL